MHKKKTTSIRHNEPDKMSIDNEEVSSEENKSNDDESSSDKMDEEPKPGKSNLKLSPTSQNKINIKKKKRGILYISSIPKFMNVTMAKEIFEQYAKVGRIYFEPIKTSDDKSKNNKKRRSRHFSEGWVEFESKRAAKQIAVELNNTPIASRKSSKFYGILWNLKYLARFKWIHLTERLTYEREVHKHKLRAEMALARREASFFQDNLDRSEQIRRKKDKKKVV